MHPKFLHPTERIALNGKVTVMLTKVCSLPRCAIDMALMKVHIWETSSEPCSAGTHADMGCPDGSRVVLGSG